MVMKRCGLKQSSFILTRVSIGKLLYCPSHVEQFHFLLRLSLFKKGDIQPKEKVVLPAGENNFIFLYGSLTLQEGDHPTERKSNNFLSSPLHKPTLSKTQTYFQSDTYGCFVTASGKHHIPPQLYQKEKEEKLPVGVKVPAKK